MIKKKNKTNKKSRSHMSKVAVRTRILECSDISNRAVMILLVIVILVGVVSTNVYLQALESLKPKVLMNSGVAKGEVKITLVPSNDFNEERVTESKSTTNSMNAQVALTILPSE